MLAQYCESATLDSQPGESWRCWQEFTVRSKFRGRYLEIEPIGIAHLVFPKSGNHYTWRKGNKWTIFLLISENNLVGKTLRTLTKSILKYFSEHKRAQFHYWKTMGGQQWSNGGY